MNLNVKISLEIPDNRIADLLCCALEGGSNYWVNEVDVHKPAKEDLAKPWGDEYTPSYISAPFSSGGYLTFSVHEDKKKYTLDRKALIRGMKRMAKHKARHHFQNFMNENEDAETGDVYLQICLFGDIIYG